VKAIELTALHRSPAPRARPSVEKPRDEDRTQKAPEESEQRDRENPCHRIQLIRPR